MLWSFYLHFDWWASCVWCVGYFPFFLWGSWCFGYYSSHHQVIDVMIRWRSRVDDMLICWVCREHIRMQRHMVSHRLGRLGYHYNLRHHFVLYTYACVANWCTQTHGRRAAIVNGFNSIYKIIAQSRFVYRRRIFTVNGVYHQSRSLAAHVLKVKSHKLAPASRSLLTFCYCPARSQDYRLTTVLVNHVT